MSLLFFIIWDRRDFWPKRRRRRSKTCACIYLLMEDVAVSLRGTSVRGSFDFPATELDALTPTTIGSFYV